MFQFGAKAAQRGAPSREGGKIFCKLERYHLVLASVLGKKDIAMASDTLTAKLVTMCLLGGISLFLGLIPIKISKGRN